MELARELCDAQPAQVACYTQTLPDPQTPLQHCVPLEQLSPCMPLHTPLLGPPMQHS